jgi:hypothetical protein
MWMMAEFSVLTGEFVARVVKTCSQARAAALQAGHSVVYRDADGRYVAEHPGGKRFEVSFDPARPRQSHLLVLREISSGAA